MKYIGDTISAISTPIGTGGISVLRVSGENAAPVVDQIFKGRQKLSKLKSHTVTFGRIFDDDLLIDEVLATVFRSPHSYTGEDVVEISCHGSSFVANQILEILLRKTRLAEPGEFTQRAFLNDRIGLTQAEAVGNLLNAKTRISHLAAIQQLEGSLRKRIEKLLHKATELRTLLELEIDFAEQGLEQLDKENFHRQFSAFRQDLEKLAATGSEGLILKDGLKVSLAGTPNVGKSSIFNAFLQTERAIVTPHPGTTRDYLEEAISLQGYLIRFFDTAGIHAPADEVEKIGIDRSYEVIADSHKILFISAGDDNEEEYRKLKTISPESRFIKVLNKADLFSEKELDRFRKKGYVICSTVSPDGLRELKKVLIEDIRISQEELQSGILTNTRQIAAVNRAVESVRKADESIRREMGCEFTAFDLKEASTALEEIIGKVTSDDILNQIFENFCVGK